jgi:hypothetical protein
MLPRACADLFRCSKFRSHSLIEFSRTFRQVRSEVFPRNSSLGQLRKFASNAIVFVLRSVTRCAQMMRVSAVHKSLGEWQPAAGEARVPSGKFALPVYCTLSCCLWLLVQHNWTLSNFLSISNGIVFQSSLKCYVTF